MTNPFKSIQFGQTNNIPHFAQQISSNTSHPQQPSIPPPVKDDQTSKDVSTTPLNPGFVLGMMFSQNTLIIKEKQKDKGVLYEVCVRNAKGFDMRIASIWKGTNAVGGTFWTKMDGPDHISFNNQYFDIVDWVKSSI